MALVPCTWAGSAYAVAAKGTAYGIDEGLLGAASGGMSRGASAESWATAGEALAGHTASGVDAARTGYVPTLSDAIRLSVATPDDHFDITPDGRSTTAASLVAVTTDAAGYSLTLESAGDLLHTNGTTTIPAIGASVATPAPWSEFTTTGLGFTISGANVDAKWGTSPNGAYAAIPTAATEVHGADAYRLGVDEIEIEYRVATQPAQLEGAYAATISITSVPKP